MLELTLRRFDFQQPNGEVDFWRDYVLDPLGIHGDDVEEVTLHIHHVDTE